MQTTLKQKSLKMIFLIVPLLSLAVTAILLSTIVDISLIKGIPSSIKIFLLRLIYFARIKQNMIYARLFYHIKVLFAIIFNVKIKIPAIADEKVK